MGDPEHDLVLLGATGYVGRLTAAHLARSAPAGTRIALAGRSAQRLTALRTGLGEAAASWELRTVDVTDAAAIDRLAVQTRVLATTVGPYARWGLPVVAACAARGTHYADLTGETLFVRDSVATSHATATASGARVVHSCGFDSVPSDLGVRLLADQAQTDGQGTLGVTTLHVRDMRGGVSGGTVDSLRQQQIAVEGRPELRRVVADPDALTGGTTLGRGSRGHAMLTRGAADGVWSAPFAMGSFNRQIVLRTDALLEGAYGPSFDYREVVDTAPGPVGAGAALAVAAVQGALVGALASRTTRVLADRVLPAPGRGPSARARRRGRFSLEVRTVTTTGARYAATVAAPYDPGYDGTAVLLGESALALAFDDLPDAAGVLTPMTGIGVGLADRLRAHGFEVGVRRLDSNAS
ncbi:MAG TPA: saccharopine dehydrogenase NADP-binding domain-containing protein [Friedmanniella sp.]